MHNWKSITAMLMIPALLCLSSCGGASGTASGGAGATASVPEREQAAAQEFATTYELGKTIGQQEAQQIVNDVKMQVINGTLEEDNSLTYEEITDIVNDVVNNYNK